MVIEKIYDICIIGAGPAGSTCAYYLAQKGFEPLILEKKEFPRDKICGDAFTQRCFVHLERMGVLHKLIEENKGHWTALGGLVSPSGITYIGDSASETQRLVKIGGVWKSAPYNDADIVVGGKEDSTDLVTITDRYEARCKDCMTVPGLPENPYSFPYYELGNRKTNKHKNLNDFVSDDDLV